MVRRRSPGELGGWRRRFVQRIARSRATTCALVARIPADSAERPRVQGDWSIKDVLAHLAGWEQEGTKRLRLIRRGRADRIVWYETKAELDRFNARAVRGARRATMRELLRRLARTRAELVRALRRLPRADLGDPGHALPVTTWLTEFALTHEQAHRRAIRSWWRDERRRAGRRG